MLTIHTTGNWPRGAIQTRIVPNTRRIVPEVEELIARRWSEGEARFGSRLFDGSMCRMEAWRASADALGMDLSPVGYRIFFGTNLAEANLAQRFGHEVMANPVGISSALLTRDGWLLFGRRNSNVAYHPNRVHPFAGSLEEKDLADVFGAVEREMQEELKLSPGDFESITCIGMAEDEQIQHPELIFRTQTKLTRAQIEKQVHPEEHGGSMAIKATALAIEDVLMDSAEFTPIAIATLLLFGNHTFGGAWFWEQLLSMPAVHLAATCE